MLEKYMQESSLAILADIHHNLSQMTLTVENSSPPVRLRLKHPKAALLGQATKEQKAIACLYDEICTLHMKEHKVAGLAEGINPRVSFDHYYYHVAAPLLMELLIWSVHRGHPAVSETMSIVDVQVDENWNLYAVPRVVK